MGLRATLLLAMLSAAAPAAATDSRSILGVNPDLVAGAEALRLGRFDEGIALTEAGLRGGTTPDQRASALNNLCAGYTALRRYDLAIVHCTESLSIDPGAWQAYNNRALAYLGKGLVELARRDVDRGLQLNAEASQLLQVRAMVEDAASRSQSDTRRIPQA